MNGILLIDKEQEWTSNDVVSKLRGILRQKRIGHAGTLDPMATGLLTVFVGRATRAVEFAENHDKRYIAGLKLGLRTDTLDIWGKSLEEKSAGCTRQELETVLHRFTGEIMQIPPMYSAIKVKGQRLYDIARRGGEVERSARPVTVHSIDLLQGQGSDWLLDIHCSKGTYIRSLCDDIGAALGCGGCMSSLRRISAGDFSLEGAYSLAQVQRAADQGQAGALLIPVDRLFEGYPKHIVSPGQEKRIKNGNEIRFEAEAGLYRVYSQGGEFLALSRAQGGSLKTVKSFYEV